MPSNSFYTRLAKYHKRVFYTTSAKERNRDRRRGEDAGVDCSQEGLNVNLKRGDTEGEIEITQHIRMYNAQSTN